MCTWFTHHTDEGVHQAENMQQLQPNAPPVSTVDSGSSGKAQVHQAQCVQQPDPTAPITVSSDSSDNSPVPNSSNRKRGSTTLAPTRQLRSASAKNASSTPIPERRTGVDTPSSTKVDFDNSTTSESDNDTSVSVSRTDSVFFLGNTFQATTSSQALVWLLRNFARVHVGGHVACRNSNFRKVLVACKLCDAGATVGVFHGHTWILRHMREGASAPCKYSDKEETETACLDNTGKAAAAHHQSSSINRNVTASSVAAPSLKCTLCTWEFEGFPKKFVSCELNDKHKFCVECFSEVVKQCVNGAGRNAFIDSGVINCPFCAAPEKRDYTHAFNMRVCCQYLDEHLYERYMSGLSERQVIRAQMECEIRVKKALQDVQQNQTLDLQNEDEEIGLCQCF